MDIHFIFEPNMAPKGPYTLCTVNKIPARAKILVGRVVENVKERYTINYAANCESKTPLSSV